MRAITGPLLLSVMFFATSGVIQSVAASSPGLGNDQVCAACILADMRFLTDDALHGRGSGTRDEHIAALYAASQFERLGLEPGGDRGTFLQKAPLPHPLPNSLAQRLKHYENTARTETWNTIAILRGTSNALDTATPHSQAATSTPVTPMPVSGKTGEEAILLTAHLDHLGIGPAVAGDSIYNGADDDASGTTAILALARAITDGAARGKRPRRTIIFALFGSEEIGGYGNRYFLEHPPIPLNRLVANLEFEMIGRPDPSVSAGKFWLTGYERTNLGPALIAHGARLAPDPHPAEKFFTRSDNYALAKRGIVAQTVSSFNLHKDYHQPSDELSRIDLPYMTEVIGSMVAPIEWLATGNFVPAWLPGGKP